MSQRLILLRHARIAADLAGRLIGTTDAPLDAVGQRQARALAAGVRAMRPDRCYASPMLRCRQTVEAVIPGVPVQFEDDLREIDFGRWEKLSFEEAAANDPAAVDRWAAFHPEFAFPEGENLGGFFRRVATVADRLTAVDAPVVLVVAHGGVIRAMLCHLLGLEPRQHVAFRIDYGAMAMVEVFERRGVLSRLLPCEIPENADG
jgi:broad specificity phosphatase PhoE